MMFHIMSQRAQSVHALLSVEANTTHELAVTQDMS